ncbi:MAG: anti-sigma factor [Streptosporangiaceae bacterium]|jgi:anti-sigma-K factor RskA
MRLLRHDLHALSGAYALDALEGGAEFERFTRHLSRCPSCASEVRGFREVATSLAFAAAAQPPPELRAQVLVAATRIRQLPPEVKTHARPRRARAWVPWLSGAIATAGIAVAVVFGLAQAHTQQELNQARAQNQDIALVLSAPQVKLLTHTTTAGGVATVVLAADRHQLVVTTSGLPALPAGKVYQLWFIGPKKIVSAGLLPTATSGQTSPVLASGIVHGDKLGLTVEPAPGSAQPTTTPILDLALPV